MTKLQAVIIIILLMINTGVVSMFFILFAKLVDEFIDEIKKKLKSK